MGDTMRRGKPPRFLQAAAIYLAVPELFPLAVICFPRLMPSTFETDASRAKRYHAMSIGRTKAVTKVRARARASLVRLDPNPDPDLGH